MKCLDTAMFARGDLAARAVEMLRETVDENPWIPWKPHPKQRTFLACPLEEVLFGGAAGGAKTVALLMAAAQYVTRPGYRALLLRRNLPMLELPGGLIDISKQWWMNTPAVWSEQKKNWIFPSGAIIQFGYLDTYNDVFRYQGSAWDLTEFDELTQFPQEMYRYLFSRLRRVAGATIPARMRSSANPGGIGHEWVKQRFIVGREGHFIPSRLEDNPSLDQAEYETKLAKLDPVTRRQLRRGDWDVRPEGNFFKRDWFKSIQQIPGRVLSSVRFWDLAATEKSQENEDPDYTVGAKVSQLVGGTFVISDVIRFRGTPATNERMVIATARRDGLNTKIRMEQEPGSAGKSLVSVYARKLPAYDFRGVASRRDKVTRSQALSAASERGDVLILEGEWNSEFVDELCAFPGALHDDQVDAVTGAFNDLVRTGEDWSAEDLEQMFGESDEEVIVVDR